MLGRITRWLRGGTRAGGQETPPDRLARLAADPRRAPYAALIRRGANWTEAQIDYDLDPARTVTCPHLRATEAAMRGAGLRLRYRRPGEVDAPCIIGPAARQAAATPPVAYLEPLPVGRAHEDPREAMLRCAACGSAIHALHPRDAPPGTPRWDGPPQRLTT